MAWPLHRSSTWPCFIFLLHNLALNWLSDVALTLIKGMAIKFVKDMALEIVTAFHSLGTSEFGF